MHANKLNNIFTLVLLMAAVAGCASNKTQVDSTFGDAVNAAKAQQTINPEASQNTEAVEGLDGKAANAVMDRYHKSFEKPPVTGNIFNIGVGSGGTGASSSGSSGGGTGTSR